MPFRYLSLICLLIAICFPAAGVAAQSLSPVEVKYQQKNPELFKKYLTAKTLISQPGENKEKLEEANIILEKFLKRILISHRPMLSSQDLFTESAIVKVILSCRISEKSMNSIPGSSWKYPLIRRSIWNQDMPKHM